MNKVKKHYEKLMMEIEKLLVEQKKDEFYDTVAYSSWCRATPLFNMIKGCRQCLTQMKNFPETVASVRMAETLELSTNNFIPAYIPQDWRPTSRVLHEFAGLQLVAKFGEPACRKAGVLED